MSTLNRNVLSSPAMTSANWYRFPGYQTDALSRRIEHLFLEEIPDICQFFENEDDHKKDALNKPVKTSEK